MPKEVPGREPGVSGAGEEQLLGRMVMHPRLVVWEGRGEGLPGLGGSC